MRQGALIKCLEAGCSQLKEAAGLPPWLLPSLPEVVWELGEERILEMAEPVGLSQKVKTSLAQAPEVDQILDSQWQAEISHWDGLNQLRPVILALLRAMEKVEALQRRDQLWIDPARVARSLATIACASFLPEGETILARLAVILESHPDQPEELIYRYIQALAKNDWDTLAKIEQTVLQNPVWSYWSQQFLAQGKSFPFTPKIVGICPASGGELTRLLSAMLKEVLSADDRRDHPGRESQNCPPAAQ